MHAAKGRRLGSVTCPSSPPCIGKRCQSTIYKKRLKLSYLIFVPMQFPPLIYYSALKGLISSIIPLLATAHQSICNRPFLPKIRRGVARIGFLSYNDKETRRFAVFHFQPQKFHSLSRTRHQASVIFETQLHGMLQISVLCKRESQDLVKVGFLHCVSFHVFSDSSLGVLTSPFLLIAITVLATTPLIVSTATVSMKLG